MMAYMGLPLDLFGNVRYCTPLVTCQTLMLVTLDVGRVLPAVFAVTAA